MFKKKQLKVHKHWRQRELGVEAHVNNVMAQAAYVYQTWGNIMFKQTILCAFEDIVWKV